MKKVKNLDKMKPVKQMDHKLEFEKILIGALETKIANGLPPMTPAR